jgi:hypothetical protein
MSKVAFNDRVITLLNSVREQYYSMGSSSFAFLCDEMKSNVLYVIYAILMV